MNNQHQTQPKVVVFQLRPFWSPRYPKGTVIGLDSMQWGWVDLWIGLANFFDIEKGETPENN